MNNTSNLDDLIAALKRQSLLIISTMILVFGVVVVITQMLPKVYYSETSILIEKPEIPKDLVDTSAASYINDRIEILKKKLITRNNLELLSTQLNLASASNDPILLKDLQEAIQINIDDAQPANSKNSRAPLSAIGITVGFEADTPQLAQSGANLITQMILQAHRKDREDKVANITTFLTNETDLLAKELVLAEQQLAKFKQHNSQQLPNLLDVNLKILELAENQIETETNTIQELELRQLTLQGELEQLSTNYDVNMEVRQLKDSLATLKLKYSDDHPDVISLKNTIAFKEQALSRNPPTSESIKAYQSVSPEFIAVSNELKETETGILAAQRRLEEQLKKKKDYEARIFKTPVVEKEYLSLMRNYQQKLDAYEQVKDQLLKARISESLEKEQKAERFVLLESASLPIAPIRPNLLGYTLLGSFLALFCGICAATVAEYRNNSVRNLKDVIAIMEAAPLASIPMIPGPRVFQVGGWVLLLILLAVASSGFVLYLMRLNIIQT